MSIEAMKLALKALEYYTCEEIAIRSASFYIKEAIEQAEKQEPVDWDLSNSATVERARKVVKLITERNQNAWSETDRETVHAINALINFAVMQFHRANTAPREWVGLRDEDLPEGETYDFDRGVRWAERNLKEKNT